MSLKLLAQQYLPISPRHLSLLTTDGEDGNPAAVVAMAAAFDPQNRVYFLEWDNPTDAASFRLTHVRVPGSNSSSGSTSSSITGLTLTRSIDGVIHCIVQCATVKGKGNGNTMANVYLYRRTVETNSDNEDDNDNEDNDNENDNYGMRNPSVVEVRYRKMPKAMEDDGRLWTASTRLYRSDGGNNNNNNSSSGGGGRVMVACGGVHGTPNALKLLRLTGTRLTVEKSLELPVLSGFPVQQLRDINSGCVISEGEGEVLLALCHHAVLAVDVRLRAVVRAWRWTPHDILTALAVRDNAVVAGTEEGVVVAWDMRTGGNNYNNNYNNNNMNMNMDYNNYNNYCSGGRRDEVVDHSDACGAPVTGLHMPHSTTLLSAHADGSVLLWDRRTATTRTQIASTAMTRKTMDGFRFAATAAAADVLPPVFAGSPGCVGLAGEDQLVVVADESGTISVFAML